MLCCLRSACSRLWGGGIIALCVLDLCFLFLLPQLGHFAHEYAFLYVQHLAALLYIFRAYDGFGNDRNALYDIFDDLTAFVWVALSIIHQEIGLEADEVHLMRSDVFLKLRSIMLTSKTVGVFTIGEQHHLDVHALLKQHVDTAQRSFYTRPVTIV